MQTVLASFFVFGAAMLWATDAPFRLLLTQEYSSTFIVFAEHCVGIFFALPLVWFNRSSLSKLSKKEWAALLIIGVGGSAFASIAFTQAFHYVNPSVAILLQKLQPILVISLAAVFLQEKLTPYFFGFAAAALFGAYLISFPNLVPQLYAGEVFNPNLVGVSWALLAVCLWAVSTVLGKYMLGNLDFKLLTGLRFSIAFVFLFFFSLATTRFPAANEISLQDIGLMLVIGLVSGVLSLLLYYKGLKNIPASVATIAELGFPVAAVLINWIFIPSGSLTVVQLVGIVILLISVALLGRYSSTKG
jgi:drug/metabolite transporter (DMT)-like permease